MLKSVTQSGNKVVLDFKNTAVPYFYYVADQISLLPQHIWASIKNPVTYWNATPVGTGPYTVSNCTGQKHNLHRQRQLLAAGPAQGKDDRVPGVHVQRPRQRGTSHRGGAAGRPVHP